MTEKIVIELVNLSRGVFALATGLADSGENDSHYLVLAWICVVETTASRSIVSQNTA